MWKYIYLEDAGVNFVCILLPESSNTIWNKSAWLIFIKWWNFVKNCPWTPKWVILTDVVKLWNVSWFGVVSHFPHFWGKFLINFDVTSLKAKLRTFSTRIWIDIATWEPTRHGKMAKTCRKIADIGKCPKISGDNNNYDILTTFFFYQFWLNVSQIVFFVETNK